MSAVTAGRPVGELETPALVVDLDRLERNLRRAAEYASAHGLALYPHAKTHKTREIAAAQLAHGAAGLTTAKSLEAEIFAEALEAPVLVHYPVAGPEKAARLAQVAGRGAADDRARFFAVAEPIADALRSRGTEAEALIELDVGLGRTGLDPEGAVELGREIERLGGPLRVAGLSFYPATCATTRSGSPPGSSRSRRRSSGLARCSSAPGSTARGSPAARPRPCSARTRRRRRRSGPATTRCSTGTRRAVVRPRRLRPARALHRGLDRRAAGASSSTPGRRR